MRLVTHSLLRCALRGAVGIGLAALASAQEAAEERVEPGPRAKGGTLLEWTTPEGQEYWYRLPKKISERRPPNLILMLHGTGLDHRWSFWNYPIATGQFRGDDIVVSPDGLTPQQGTASERNPEGTFNFLQGKKDKEQIVGLIELFKSQFPIGNVYLYGHSQGAFFCFWFAGECPELVDGIVAHAGNVLSVRHTKLSRDKVAIGILHGKSDQVVPVECAHASEAEYKREGYKKLKLYVVEGLGDHAGHWPLPVQVGEMFEWVDQVSAQTPGQAVGVALSEISKEAPDLHVIAEAVETAHGLMKKYREDDAEELEARLGRVELFLASAASAHAAALVESAPLAERGLPFGEWAAHFVAVDAGVELGGGWPKELAVVSKAADKHEKAVDKALAGFTKPSKSSFSKGLDALEEGYLAARYEELAQVMARQAEDPPKGVSEKQLAALAALSSEREAPWAAGLAAARTITAETAASFRAEHPDLFEDA